MTNHIDPSDDAKVYHFLTKFIDNLWLLYIKKSVMIMRPPDLRNINDY